MPTKNGKVPRGVVTEVAFQPASFGLCLFPALCRDNRSCEGPFSFLTVFPARFILSLLKSQKTERKEN